ncbi:uncharacterized protein LOC135393063 isoform X1 [Ornithodoros turicata]|uniref:uncharacterized protein LOC135393063 isoform X1 n=1 Tax=Ornithodoros turicata TaxID=34597 RepID=UPI003139B4D3
MSASHQVTHEQPVSREMDAVVDLGDHVFHVGVALFTLWWLGYSIYSGLHSVPEVTAIMNKCLLLPFHFVRLRHDYGVLCQIATWVLDMAFHVWFLFVSCSQIISGMFFHSWPFEIMGSSILFIFHLEVIRKYCNAVQISVENVGQQVEEISEHEEDNLNAAGRNGSTPQVDQNVVHAVTQTEEACAAAIASTEVIPTVSKTQHSEELEIPEKFSGQAQSYPAAVYSGEDPNSSQNVSVTAQGPIIQV